ncbi:SDR family oxidoreductase, partial [Actinomadura fibrosa]
SSFGISGTNAHLILQQPPDSAETAPAGAQVPRLPCVLSARTPEALAATARRLTAHLTAHPETEPATLGGILATGRAHFAHRAAVTASDRDGLVNALDALAEDRPAPALVRGEARTPGRPTFLFPGQGTQWAGMGAGLYAAFPLFAEAYEQVRAELDRHLDRPLSTAAADPELIGRTGYAQPALFALEVALHRLLLSYGLRPDYLIGHSLGELSAAQVAGVFDLADACVLVAARARLMESVGTAGAMVALRADPGEVVPHLSPEVSIAAVNGPAATVISGDETAVLRVADHFRAAGRQAERLRVTRAFHSAHLDRVLDEFREVAATVGYREPSIPVISGLTGTPDEAMWREGPDYWTTQLRETVRFMAGVHHLQDRGVGAYVEVGPGSALTVAVKECLTGEEVILTPTLRRGRPEPDTVLRALAELHCEGVPVHWPRTPARFAEDLPTYAFQHRRYWLTAPAPHETPEDKESGSSHSLLGTRMEVAGSAERRFTRSLHPDRTDILADHRLSGTVVMPAAAMVEWALAAIRDDDRTAWRLDDVVFHRPMSFPGDRPMTVQAVALDGAVRGFARPGGGRDGAAGERWQEYVTVAKAGPAGEKAPEPADVEALRTRMTELDVEQLYERLLRLGLEYGPAYRGLRGLWRCDDAALARVEGPGPGEGWTLPPAVLDGCFQTMGAFLDGTGAVPLPVSVDRITVFDPLPARLWCHARRRAADRADLELLSESGRRLATVEGLRVRTFTRADLTSLVGPALRGYRQEWRRAEGLRAGDWPPEGNWLVLGSDSKTAGEWRRALAGLGIGRPGARIDGLLYVGVMPKAPADPRDLPDAACHLAGKAAATLQRFLRAHVGDVPRIVICSAGAAVPDPDGDAPDLVQTVLASLARSVAAEHPRVPCVHVDLGRGEAPPPKEILARAVALPGSGHLAVRDGRWFEARLAEVAAPRHAPPPIRADATYLITGGRGGLGSAVAGWLADRGARSLLILGRGAEHTADPALARLGVQVEYVQADVADPAALDRALAHARDVLPPIRGIVHAAGLAADAALVDMTPDRFQRALAPKVRGAWHLHRAADRLELDFFVMFSSLAALIGSPGQANYMVGNAFMDALAEHRRLLGEPAVSIGWGPWAEVGMAVRHGALDSLAASGVQPVTPREGLQALAGLLTADGPVGLGKVDWWRFGAAVSRPVPYALLTDVLPAGPAGFRAARAAELALLAARDPAAARDGLVADLAERAGSLLGLDEAGRSPDLAETRLSELGLDSLMAVRLREQILADYRVEIAPDVLLGQGTALSVADAICRQLMVRSVLSDGDPADGDEETEVLVL